MENIGLSFYLETWKNLQFDNLGKKTWNLRNFEKKLEFLTISTCSQ